MTALTMLGTLGGALDIAWDIAKVICFITGATGIIGTVLVVAFFVWDDHRCHRMDRRPSRWRLRRMEREFRRAVKTLHAPSDPVHERLRDATRPPLEREDG